LSTSSVDKSTNTVFSQQTESGYLF